MRTDPGLQLRPTVHVGDLATALAFYEHLGGEVVHGGPDTGWVLLQLGTIQLVLVAQPPDTARGESRVELTDVTTDRDFGERLEVRSPDGLLIKIGQSYA
jgi:catechol 2,3-dioxygenase-like lactoylglutathione lyase family enzyme